MLTPLPHLPPSPSISLGQIDDIDFECPDEASFGSGARITRYALRVALADVSSGSSAGGREERGSGRFDPARPSSAPPTSRGGNAPSYTFYSNVLTLDVDYDSRGRLWRLASPKLLVRPPADRPRDAQLFIELTMTVSRPDQSAPSGSSRGGVARGGSRGRTEPTVPRVESTVTAAWAQLPLATIAQGGGGGSSSRGGFDPARPSGGGSGGGGGGPQHLTLMGGSIFRPRELGGGRGDDRSRGVGRNRVAPAPGGGATLNVRIGTVGPDERTQAAFLPVGCIVPASAMSLLTGYRKLLASPPEGAHGLPRNAQQVIVATAAEQTAAVAGMGAVAAAPDVLSTFATMYAEKLAEATRRGSDPRGGSGRPSGGGSGRFDPARPSGGASRGLDERDQLRELKEILLLAPLLGASSGVGALPPYESAEPRAADDRRSALERLSRECVSHGALQVRSCPASPPSAPIAPQPSPSYL